MRHLHCTVYNLTSTYKAFINESMAHISSECWSESIFSPFFVTCVSNSAMVLGSVEVTGTNFAISPTLSVISPIFCNRLWLNKISKCLLLFFTGCVYTCTVVSSLGFYIFSTKLAKRSILHYICIILRTKQKQHIWKKKKF